MRKTIPRALLVLAISCAAALAADNSLGVWKLDVAKSSYSPAPLPVKSLTTTRESAPDGVKVTFTGERTDGSPVNGSYTTKYDGASAEVSGTGSPYNSIAVKQVNANTFTYEAKDSNSKYHANGRAVISKDGKMMTTTAKGTNAAGEPMTVKLVYEKQ